MSERDRFSGMLPGPLTALIVIAAVAGGMVSGAAAADSDPGIRFGDVAATSGIRMTNVCGERSKDYVVESIGPGACWLD